MTEIDQPVPPSRVYSDVEYIFEARSATMPPLREYLAELWERRRFMVALAKADLRGPRANTVIGELWGVLDPLFQAAIYWFLITVLRKGRGGSGSEYLSLIVSSVFLFNFTRIALSEGGRSVLKSKGLMLNSTFPRALLPISSVYKGLLEFAPSVGVYLVIHILLRRPFGPGLFMLPLLFAIQIALSLGLAMLFAALTVYIRDLTNVLNYVLRVLLFVTPVIYPVSLLTPTLRSILKINPLFTLFAAYQSIILGDVPSASLVIQSLLWAALFLVVGFRVFVSNERSFALRL
ncbi:MAG: ABC transporter permease [Acidimicrobiales bacterium]